MTLDKTNRFDSELDEIVDFIADDSPIRALEFFDELIAKIETIPSNPYLYRKRQPLNDANIREMIFKGYTIPFYVDKRKEVILILGIFNQNLWE